MKSHIFVKKLTVQACHGCNAEEKIKPQPFVFSVEIFFDAKKGMLSDELKDVICYAKVSQIIHNITTKNTFNMVERLAFEIFEEIFSLSSLVEKIALQIEKPNSPIDFDFESVGFSAEISREEFTAIQ